MIWLLNFGEIKMPYWVYILRSYATGKLYIGHTSDLERRIMRHNSEEAGSRRYTHRQEGLWNLVYSEEKETRSEAMMREKYLKSGQGRKWINANVLKE